MKKPAKSPSEKHAAVCRVEARIKAGDSLVYACAAERVPAANFIRWRKALHTQPEISPEAALAPRPFGRPRKRLP